jgi:hypothetical protein
MIGFPFFYEKNYIAQKDLDQDDKFMIFSLDPIPENSDLKLNKLSTLPIILESSKLPLGDEFTYQFCDQISQICGTFHSLPETQTLVLDYDGFCRLVSNSDRIISTLASELEITKQSAMQQAQQFFSNKNVVVQPGGVQGTIYKVGSYLQSAGSAGLVANSLGVAKLAGVNGLQILQAQPFLAVAIPTTGAIFFYGFGTIVGNNSFGKALITTGDVLALPMKCVEIMWNSYGNSVTQKLFGIPTILNMTQTFKTGTGYTIPERAKHIKFDKKSILRSIKDRIIKWLS